MGGRRAADRRPPAGRPTWTNGCPAGHRWGVYRVTGSPLWRAGHRWEFTDRGYKCGDGEEAKGERGGHYLGKGEHRGRKVATCRRSEVTTYRRSEVTICRRSEVTTDRRSEVTTGQMLLGRAQTRSPLGMKRCQRSPPGERLREGHRSKVRWVYVTPLLISLSCIFMTLISLNQIFSEVVKLQARLVY